MIFHKIRSEYRCEKLLMLYILDKIRTYLYEKRDMINPLLGQVTQLVTCPSKGLNNLNAIFVKYN